MIYSEQHFSPIKTAVRLYESITFKYSSNGLGLVLRSAPKNSNLCMFSVKRRIENVRNGEKKTKYKISVRSISTN